LWAPVLNAGWRADAGLFDAARAWGAALPWAHAEEDAFRAVGLAEDRLREVHPYAMDIYDQQLQARLAMPDAQQFLARAEAMLAAVDSFALHPHDGTHDPAFRLSDFEMERLRRVLGTIGAQSARLGEAGQALDPEVAANEVRKVAPEIAGHIAEGVAAGNSVLPDPGRQAQQAQVQPTILDFDKTSALNWHSSVHQGLAATAMRRAAGGKHAAAHRTGPKQTTNIKRPGLGTH
jgi:hypothetical protein